MGNTEESVLEEAEVEEIVEVEEKEDENKEPESIEESVKAAIEEIKQQEGDGEEGEETKETAPRPVDKSVERHLEEKPKGKPGRPKKEEVEEEVDIPDHLEPKHKALLAKLEDKELKRGISKLVKHYEATRTRVAQEASEAKKEVATLLDTVKPYVDQFTERNLTISQGIGQLLVANKKLINTKDPETQIEEAARIVVGCQIDPDALYARLTGAESAKTSSKVDISNDPYVKQLEAKINSLTEKLEPVYNERKVASDEAYQSTLEKLQSVQLETNEDGEYVRPELAQDAQFLEIWKPLVSRLVKTEGLDYADAGKKAYAILKGQPTAKPIKANTPTQNNLNKRSVSAAVSVRGRTAPMINGVDYDEEVPKNETIAQSVMRAVQSLR